MNPIILQWCESNNNALNAVSNTLPAQPILKVILTKLSHFKKNLFHFNHLLRQNRLQTFYLHGICVVIHNLPLVEPCMDSSNESQRKITKYKRNCNLLIAVNDVSVSRSKIYKPFETNENLPAGEC